MAVSITGIAIVIVVLIFLIKGWKTGLVKAVFDLVSFFIISILTWLLYPTVSKILISTPLYDGINNWISLTLKDNEIVSTGLSEFLGELPSFLKDSILVSSKEAFESMIVSTVDALTVLSINAISIIILFVFLFLLSFLIKRFGKFINNIIIIGQINKIFGGAFGFIQGVFICYLIIMITSYFPATKVYNFIANDMEKSYVCKIMYNDNVNFFGFKPTYPIIRGD